MIKKKDQPSTWNIVSHSNICGDIDKVKERFNEAIQTALDIPIPTGKKVSVELSYEVILAPRLTAHITNDEVNASD
jgi:hypothetical protein